MRGSEAAISFPFVQQPSVLLITAPPTTQPPARPATSPSATPDYADNCLNKYCRFAFNSKEVTYVLLRTFTNQPAQAIQYPLPTIAEKPVSSPSSSKEPSPFLKYTVVPTVKYLTTNVYAYGIPNGQLAITGEADQQLMRSKRAYHFQIQEGNQESSDYTFYPGSPTTPDAFAGYNIPVKLFKETEAAKHIIDKKGGRQKKGKVRLNKADILERDKITYRNPDQNTTMGLSAVTEMAHIIEQYDFILTEDAKKIIQDSAEAELSAKANGQIRTEWGHGNSFRHTPMSENPQRKDNLAAMRKCHNTEMMIGEGVAKWFALNIPHADVETEYAFDMLLDTDAATHIYFCAMIIVNQFKIKLTQKINPLTKYPAYVKTSDLAGLIHILFSMMNHVSPRFIQPIDVLIHEKYIERPVAAFFSRKRITETKNDEEPAKTKQRFEMT